MEELAEKETAKTTMPVKYYHKNKTNRLKWQYLLRLTRVFCPPQRQIVILNRPQV